MEFLEEIRSWVVPLVVLLQVILREEELGTVSALDDVLLLVGWQAEQVLIGAQSFLLDL